MTEISSHFENVIEIGVTCSISEQLLALLKFIERHSERRSVAIFWNMLKKLHQIAAEHLGQ